MRVISFQFVSLVSHLGQQCLPVPTGITQSGNTATGLTVSVTTPAPKSGLVYKFSGQDNNNKEVQQLQSTDGKATFTDCNVKSVRVTYEDNSQVSLPANIPVTDNVFSKFHRFRVKKSVLMPFCSDGMRLTACIVCYLVQSGGLVN